MSASQRPFIHLDESLEAHLREEFLRPGDASDPLFNLVRGAIAAHEHAVHFPDLSKEAFLNFMADAWEAGAHQLKIERCEIEGSIMNGLGVAANFAARIALSGKRLGVLPS